MEKKFDLEAAIDETKKRIAELMQKMQEYKRFHPEYKDEGVYKAMTTELGQLQSKLVQLKQTRKTRTSDMRQLRWKIFKELVEERLGPAELEKMLQESKERMKQYQYDINTRTFKKRSSK